MRGCLRMFCVCVVLGLAVAPGAAADEFSVNCSGLATGLSTAEDGDVFTMNVPACPGSAFNLPDADVTIKGQAPGGTTFDNQGEEHDVFAAGPGSGQLTFSNVEVDNTDEDWSGIYVPGTGGSLTIENSEFTGANTGVFTAGPLTVTGSHFEGLDFGLGAESAGHGGTVSVTNSSFADNGRGIVLSLKDDETAALTGNLFAANTVGLDATIAAATPRTLTLTDNDFVGNESETEFGAAMRVGGSQAAHTVVQRGNLFRDNSSGHNAFFPSYGGAAFYKNVNVDSRNDAFLGNSIPNRVSGNPSLGGAIRFDCDQIDPYKIHAENLLALGNGVPQDGGSGGVIYSACDSEFVTIELVNSTLSANSGPVGSAIAGDAAHKLVLRNTIVAGNTGAPAEISGFGTGGRTIEFSDVCPLPAGAGNICAPPLLTADGDETASSPTINKGSNALIPAGLTTDVFGGPRILGGTVDIGAAEVQPAAGGGPLPDRVAPGVSGARLARSKFRVGSAATPVVARRKKAPAGTTISYTLTEAATVKLLIERKVKGRKVKKGKGRKAKTRCVGETRRNKKGHKKCTLFKKAGTLTRNSKPGVTKVAFSGRIGKKKLKPGSYRLSISAKDAAGNTSKTRRLNFTIVK